MTIPNSIPYTDHVQYVIAPFVNVLYKHLIILKGWNEVEESTA